MIGEDDESKTVPVITIISSLLYEGESSGEGHSSVKMMKFLLERIRQDENVGYERSNIDGHWTHTYVSENSLC